MDIVVETANKKIDIDTKGKVLKDKSPSDADLKQMFVYNLHYIIIIPFLLNKNIKCSTEVKDFVENLN